MATILHLTLRKKWFDMIEANIKKEEYREIKPYWITRLIDWSEHPKESKDDTNNIAENILFDINAGHPVSEVLKSYFCKFKRFDVIRFTNGYSKNAPTFDIECLGISIGKGCHEWGAGSVEYFIISLGKIIK